MSEPGWAIRCIRAIPYTTDDNTGDVVLAPDGSFALVGAGPEIRMLSARRGWTEIARYRDEGDEIVGPIALLPGGGQCLAGRHDGRIRLWDLAAGRVVWRSGATEPLLELGMTRDRRQVFAFGRSAFFCVDARTGEVGGSEALDLLDREARTYVVRLADGHAAFARLDATFALTVQRKTRHEPPERYAEGDFRVTAFFGESLLAPGLVKEGLGDIFAFALGREGRLAVVQHAPIVERGAAELSPDGRLVLRGFRNELTMIDAASGEALGGAALDGPHPIANLAWSADLRTAITTDALAGVRVWALEPPPSYSA